MPVVALQPKHKVSPWYVNPIIHGGKVRIYVEASQAVDVFVASAEQAPQINSVVDAVRLGVLYYPATQLVDQPITLPNTWKTGWNLIIGHAGIANQNVTAVYYAVYNA